MKKLLVSGFLVVVLTVTAVPVAAAEFSKADNPSNVSISIDGSAPSRSIYSMILQSTTYVSIRDFAEAMGAASVTWDDGIATVSAPGLYITAKVGDKYVVANGRYLFVPHACIQVNKRVMVPVRVLAKAFDAEINWDDATRTVYIKSGTGAIVPGSVYYDSTDLYWLSRIINAEARGECLEGKIAVGAVVMNRVNTPGFPKTVYDVIFDKAHGVQFTPAYNGAIKKTPSEECVIAAKIVLDGGNTAGESLYFSSTTKCWAAKARPYETTIGNHTFYA
jgi:N-acetylmuramoyl-L-alanine amidase